MKKMGLLNVWNVASATEEVNFKIWFNFNALKYQESHVASGYLTGQRRYRTLASLEEDLLDGASLITQVLEKQSFLYQGAEEKVRRI